jgi:hypothetical protein
MAQTRPNLNSAVPRALTRRRFLGEAALGAAGMAVVTTQPGCSSEASSQTAFGGRAFLQPTREEWKRREVHRSATRGWADTHFTAPAAGVPSSVSLFGEAYTAAEFASLLMDATVEMNVVYAFWDGSFVKQRETVAPIGVVADVVGASLSPPEAPPFLIARSQTRGAVFSGAPAGFQDGLVDPAYSYRLTFPREVALESGVIVFDLDTSLQYYAFAVEGYGSRAFVKYFSSIELGSEYVGPDNTGIDDYLIAKIPANQFLDLETDTFQPELPSWS